MKKIWVAALLVLALAGREAAAQTDYAEEAGFGLLAVLTNVGYMPAKLAYAAVGALVGGLAYLTSGADLDSASAVWGPPLGGTYVITSSMLRGDDPIVFAAPSHCHCSQDGGSQGPGWVEEPLS